MATSNVAPPAPATEVPTATETPIQVASIEITPTSDAWWPPVLLLSACWAVGFSVLTACAASINLTGAALSENAATATLPLALTSFTTGLYSLLLPAEFARLGRYRSYVAGALVGALGCFGCLAGCELQSMLLLCIGAVLVGVGMAHSQNFRFGVVLCVSAPKEPVAISLVLAGGVAGAIIGPEYRCVISLDLPTSHPFSPSFSHLLTPARARHPRAGGFQQAHPDPAAHSLLRHLPRQRLLLPHPAPLAPRRRAPPPRALPQTVDDDRCHERRRSSSTPTTPSTACGLRAAALLGVYSDSQLELRDDGVLYGRGPPSDERRRL